MALYRSSSSAGNANQIVLSGPPRAVQLVALSDVLLVHAAILTLMVHVVYRFTSFLWGLKQLCFFNATFNDIKDLVDAETLSNIQKLDTCLGFLWFCALLVALGFN